ncbi:MAG: hypothetical protein GDA56_31825 [Hormoscilla sp. GM7CHS1pb]|nr:hypothetical protein [Hormoscilla sp. GM7CHS1pb]
MSESAHPCRCRVGERQGGRLWTRQPNQIVRPVGPAIAQRLKIPVRRAISERNSRQIREIIRNSLNRELTRESTIHLNLTSPTTVPEKSDKNKIRLNYARRCYGGTACRLGIITTEKLTQAQEKLTGTVPEKSETSLGTGITGYLSMPVVALIVLMLP